MKVSLENTTAVITGASSGIGAATAFTMAAAGARVALVGRDVARLEDVRHEIEGRGGAAVALPADLERADEAAGVGARAAAELGRIDALVHCAGVYEPETLAATELDSFERQWAINVRAPFLLTQSLLEHLSDGAAVVFVSSTVATAGFPGCSAYSATKGAVEALARSLAVELAPRVRVNAVAPGFALTPMVTTQIDANPALEGGLVAKTPVGFIGDAEDIANSIAFAACSSVSRYMTGSTLVVDGGWTAQA